MAIGEFRTLKENNMPFHRIWNVKNPLFLPRFFANCEFSSKLGILQYFPLESVESEFRRTRGLMNTITRWTKILK